VRGEIPIDARTAASSIQGTQVLATIRPRRLGRRRRPAVVIEFDFEGDTISRLGGVESQARRVVPLRTPHHQQDLYSCSR
jgi:hypothetical protein